MFATELVDDAKTLLDELQRHSLLVATAESCTGGLLAGLLTEIPGASGMVERGFVTYSNASKTDLLGVDAVLIERHGAVSDEVARAMAEGALSHAPVHIAAAVTGIAGPDGGSMEKPVGLVYIAVSRRGEPTLLREFRFGNLGRQEIRLRSVKEAIDLMRAALSQGIPSRPERECP
jgi:nicotinamide-nucleotide amidase